MNALIQNTQEWLDARAGSLGASQVADAIARTKTGWGASRANILAQLVAERLTGRPQESYSNAAMQWGKDMEPIARSAYEARTGRLVELVGLVKHPRLEGTHASPDGLVVDDGIIEIKCPNTATHIDTLRSETIAGPYVTQIQWQMACTGRDWCDFVSFDPRMPEHMQLWVQRVDRAPQVIEELERMVGEFLGEVNATVTDLNLKYTEQF